MTFGNVNSLYPGFIKMRYTCTFSGIAHVHIMTLPCEPSYDGVAEEWHVAKKGGSTQWWKTALQDLVATFQPFYFTTDTSFGFCDLWTMEDPEADPVWQDGFDMGVAGTGGGNNNLSAAIHTFRTEYGGVFRLYLMESNIPDDNIVNPPYASNLGTMVTQMTDPDAFVKGRDGGFLTSLIRRVSKENDKLRKKYFLNA